MTSGQPLFGVFIGADFGDSTITDAFGKYTLDDVPLGPDQADRTWNVTASTPNFPPETKSVTAMQNTNSTLDFQLSVGDCDGTVIQPYSIEEGILTIDILETTIVRDGAVTLFEVY